MLEEASNIENLEVFTPWGVSIGMVNSLEIESETGEVANLFMEETNDRLVEDGASILIPFRWIQGVGDIVILKYFPENIPIRSDESMDREFY